MMALTCGLWFLLLQGPVPPVTAEPMDLQLTDWYIVYIVVMCTAAFLGILLLILIISVKMSRISKQLNEISDSATTFIRVGLDHFKDKTGRGK